MKSLSRLTHDVSPRYIEAWTPSELSSEPPHLAQEVETAQILALLQSKEESTFAQQQKRQKSGLLSAGAHSFVSTWQPQEMESQPPSAEGSEWFFAESPGDFPQEKQDWEEVLDPDEEAAVLLKQSRAQADEIILKARATAEKAILDAQADIERQKEEGFQQGRNEALNEIADAIKAVRAMAEEIQGWQTGLMAQGEQILVDMLKDVSQAMFGEGITLDAGALQANLNRIMESAQGLGDLRIFLNPKDAKALDPSWSEYQLLISGSKVRIIPSEKIRPGGCVVKGNTGTVDARVETQLNAILSTLDETRNS